MDTEEDFVAVWQRRTRTLVCTLVSETRLKKS